MQIEPRTRPAIHQSGSAGSNPIPFLPIIRSMCEAHTSAGQDQCAPNPPWRRACPPAAAETSRLIRDDLFKQSPARAPATMKNPTTGGDTSNDVKTLRTWSQFTPWLTPCPDRSALASPTPTIAPINVCELEAGNPRYHVPRFQQIAETSRAQKSSRSPHRCRR